ncbi:hypothetical protein HanIR_Chr11g0508561 [Helianthus annuus]|nr:hypothetical protein HanIR_Chr11g0508561 [Helianthus annuus]
MCQDPSYQPFQAHLCSQSAPCGCHIVWSKPALDRATGGHLQQAISHGFTNPIIVHIFATMCLSELHLLH